MADADLPTVPQLWRSQLGASASAFQIEAWRSSVLRISALVQELRGGYVWRVFILVTSTTSRIRTFRV